VPDPDDQSYDARRARVRRAYARRGRVPSNFCFVECPYCWGLIPSKDKGFVPPHVVPWDPAARCPSSRVWELEVDQAD
jgi:hypothetical protein